MYTKSKKRFQIVINIIITVITVITAIPFLLLLSASLTANQSIIVDGYSLIPGEFSLEGYAYIWMQRAQIFRAYGVTILVTLIGVLIGLSMTMLYGYALSRPQFPGKKFFSFYLFFTMLFNGGLVPTYILYTRTLHVKNTIWGLILPGLLMGAFNVILVRSFIQSTVPEALVEAAEIDGAGQFQTFFKIVLPISKPIVATVGLFIGVGYWNSWQNGLYYITDNTLYSIQQLLYAMMKNIEYLASNAVGSMSNVGLPTSTLRMAIAMVGLLPILIIYPFIQKYFVKGIAIGAVKG